MSGTEHGPWRENRKENPKNKDGREGQESSGCRLARLW
jgi:hypothetical protein